MRRLDHRLALPALAYLLVAVYLASPVLGSISTRFLGGETGDVYEMARHIWWYKTVAQNGEDILRQSLLGYPEGFAAVQLWAYPLQFFPFWLFAYVMPLAAAYNLGVILTFCMNGLSLFLLARRWLPTEDSFPPFLAGLVYMVFPMMQGHLFDGHLGLLVQWPLPLFIIFLFDYADYGGARRYLIALLFFLFAAMGHTMQLIYALAPFTALFMIARIYRRDYVGLARCAGMVAVGCLLLLLFLSPILASTLSASRITSAGGYLRYSIDLLGLVSPSFANPFWADIARHSAQVLGTNLGEGSSYIGVVGGVLAIVGIMRRRAARWWLFVAFAAWLLALGPVLKVYDQAFTAKIAGYDAVLPLPFALIMDLPIFELARAPGRFMFLFTAMFALLTGYGASEVWSSRLLARRHPYARMAFAILCVVLLVEDYKLFAQFPTVPAEIPHAIHHLRGRRDIRAIYNAPYDNLLAAKESMYLQTAHNKPLIAGQDTRITPVDPAKLGLLASFRPPLLNGAHADVVIVNKVRALESGQPGLLPRARQWLGEPFYEDQRYALFETPFIPDRVPKLHSTMWDGQSHVTYIYKEQPGWMELSAVLEAVNRRVHFSLNGAPLQTLQVNGRIPVSIPLPIARDGYHTFRIALDPPCPERIDTELLLCQGVTVESVDTQILTNGAIYDPVRLADGIELAGYYLPKQFGDEVAIRLWWRFEADRSNDDVRFVHVLDESGLPVTDRPDDHSFGEIAAGSEMTETLKLDTSKLSDGEYLVLTGWYELPFAIRYDVLTNVEGAQNDTIVLGAIRVRH
ncbi:MAG: hypothetical protein OXG78_07410 [Chloroflexi bacterium]|nr:hypothetical protein [Chloroflexota bacterium]